MGLIVGLYTSANHFHHHSPCPVSIAPQSATTNSSGSANARATSMASAAVMRQLASRSKLAPNEVEAIWRNYTQTDKPATEIAATLGHSVEWYQSPDGVWMLMASAELCLYRATSNGPAALKSLPKAARLWYRAYRSRLPLLEPQPGVITAANPKTKRNYYGPISISNDGAVEAEMLKSGKAFLLGGNMLIPGVYDINLGSRETYRQRWFASKPNP